MLGIGQSIVNLGAMFLDKFIEDPDKRREAKIQLIEMQQQGELKQLEVSMSAIVAEANSTDPYTSRARPSFMYVIYIIMLLSIPTAVLSVFYPAEVATGVKNFGNYLHAIPEWMYATFIAGYLGYTHYRSEDKKRIMDMFRDGK